MKPLLGILLLMGVAAYADNIRLYGKLNPKVSASYTKITDKHTGEVIKDMDRTQMYDNGSYIGVRGRYDINETYRMSYRAEWRTPFDDERRKLQTRDTWLAVRHKTYGTLKAGRFRTPDSHLDYSVPPNWLDGIRTNNSFRYESPVIKDSQFMVQYILDENNGTDTLRSGGYALYADHVKENYGFGASYIKASSQLPYPSLKDSLRASVYYHLTPAVQVSVLYQKNRLNYLDDEFGVSTQLEHINPNTRIRKHAFYRYSDNQYGAPPHIEHAIGFGVDKQISRQVGIGAELELSKADYQHHQAKEIGCQ